MVIEVGTTVVLDVVKVDVAFVDVLVVDEVVIVVVGDIDVLEAEVNIIVVVVDGVYVVAIVSYEKDPIVSPAWELTLLTNLYITIFITELDVQRHYLLFLFDKYSQ